MESQFRSVSPHSTADKPRCKYNIGIISYSCFSRSFHQGSEAALVLHCSKTPKLKPNLLSLQELTALCPRFAKPGAKPAGSRSFEPAHSKGHLSTIPFHTAWEISYAHRWNTEASVTTLGHSLELCIPDVNTPSPWNPWATRQRTWKLQEESKGRQELFARFPGYLCALLAVLQVCSILRVLSRGSWLLTQKLCEFLGCGIGRGRQSPWKNACKNSVHVAIYNNSRRLSLTHGSKYPQDLQYLPRTKETNEKPRDAGSE